jgi:EmrB/QacA subfamily drug resistance transporter
MKLQIDCQIDINLVPNYILDMSKKKQKNQHNLVEIIKEDVLQVTENIKENIEHSLTALEPETKVKPNKYKWFSLLILSLALAIIVIDGTVLNVSQKYVINDLNSDIQTIQWAFTSYSLVLAALTILGGRFGDLYGRKKMFILGAIIFAIGSAITAFAKDSTGLIFGWSIVEGIGAALMVPASSALIVSNFEGKERGIAFGVYGATAGAASSFGPILGGFFASTIGWRWAFGINVFIAALLCIGSIIVRDSKYLYPKKTYLDFRGAILLGVGLTTVMYGIIQSSVYGWINAKKNWEAFGSNYNLLSLSVTFWAILIGLGFLYAFVKWEAKLEKENKDPLFSLSIFKNKQFSFGIATLTALFTGFSGLITYGVVFFLLTVRNFSALQAGLALIPFSLATFIMAPVSSRIADKIGQKTLVTVGLILNFIGNILIYNAIDINANDYSFIFPFIVSGVGFGLIAAQLNNIILSAVPVAQAGVASGINGTIREIGRAVGISVIGAAFITVLSTNAVGYIQAQPSSKISDRAKVAIIDSLNKGDLAVGREPLSDQQIIDNGAKQGFYTDNQLVRTQYIADYKKTEKNIGDQIKLAITDASKESLLYTAAFTLLAVIIAQGLKEIKNEKR